MDLEKIKNPILKFFGFPQDTIWGHLKIHIIFKNYDSHNNAHGIILWTKILHIKYLEPRQDCVFLNRTLLNFFFNLFFFSRFLASIRVDSS